MQKKNMQRESYNFPFVGKLQRTRNRKLYDQEITESDIAIEWATLMGNPKATEQEQIAIAYVSISENGQVFSERKISFGNKAIEIIRDTINKD